MSAVLCCVHPRINSPEPPSRPLTVSSSSLDGLLLAAAGLPSDHPHVLRFTNSNTLPGTIDSSTILRSPGFKGRLRMKLSRRTLDPGRSASVNTEQSGDRIRAKKQVRGSRVASICSKWEIVSSGKLWDGDAKALTSTEVIYQMDQEAMGDMDEALVQGEEERGRRRRREFSEELAIRNLVMEGQHDETVSPRGVPRLVSAQSVIRTDGEVDQLQDDLAEDQPRYSSSAEDNFEILQASQHRKSPLSDAAVELDVLTLRKLRLTPFNQAPLLPRIVTSPFLPPYPEGSNETVVRRSSSVDLHPQRFKPMHSPTRLRRKSSTSFALSSLLMTDNEQDGHLRRDSDTNKVPEVKEIRVDSVGSVVEQVISVPVNDEPVLAITEKLTERASQASKSTSHAGQDAGESTVLLNKQTEQVADTPPAALLTPALHSCRVSSPSMDASSSVYSRPCSANRDMECPQPYDIPNTLAGNLADWLLRTDGAGEQDRTASTNTHGNSAPADKEVLPEFVDTNDSPLERRTLDGVTLSHEHHPISNGQPVSKSGRNSVSKGSKKSKFLEAFTPPKKSVRKRKSIFRFLRPGSLKQMRYASTPNLRSDDHKHVNAEDGAVDDTMLTVQYELTRPAENIPRRCSATEGDLYQNPVVTKDEVEHSGMMHTSLVVPASKTRPESGSSRRTSGTYLTVDDASSHRPQFRHTPSPSTASGQTTMYASVRSSLPPTPVIDLHRRPSMLEYERNLTLKGDDRRRPSVRNLHNAQEIRHNHRHDAMANAAYLSQQTFEDEEEEELNPLMASALKRHQQGKALFQSESKRRESLRLSHSSPALPNAFQLDPAGRSSSTNALLNKRQGSVQLAPDVSSPHVAFDTAVPSGLLGVEYKPLTGTASCGVPSLISVPSVFVKSPSASPSISPKTAKIGTSLPSWSRFASHTRSERCGSANAADSVKTRDFAGRNVESSADSVDEKASPTSKRSFTTSDNKKNLSPTMIKRRSMTFGGTVRYYHNLLSSSGNGFQGQNRRTSVAVSGRLEQPELEMLPPSLVPENHSNSLYEHLKQVEDSIEGLGETDAHHSPRHSHTISFSSFVQAPEQQESTQISGSQAAGSIRFRLGSLFNEPAHNIRRIDTSIDPTGTSQSTESNSPELTSVRQDSIAMSNVPETTITQVDGPSTCANEDFSKDIIGNRSQTVLMPPSPSSRADLWSQMYKSCLTRHAPAFSSVSDINNDTATADTPVAQQHSNDGHRRSQSSSEMPPPPAPILKPLKARSPEQKSKQGSKEPKINASHLDPNVRIRRFPSVTVVDDRKGHLRSVSLISTQSLSERSGSGSRRAGSALRGSTYDLIRFVQMKEKEEREKLLGLGSSDDTATTATAESPNDVGEKKCEDL